MSRHLDIEITSIRGDTATWRAAGAREPKGVVDLTALPGDHQVGTVYRAEIEQFMEGVEVIAVAPPRAASPIDPRNELLTLLAPERPGPEISVEYAAKGRGRRPEGRERSRDGARPTSSRTDAARPRTPRPDSARPRRERPPRRSGDDAATDGGENGQRPRPPRRAPAARERRGPADRERRGPADRERSGAPRERAARPAHPPVATTYRNAFLATLPGEQLPIAEELLRGGLPAVRKALEEQNRNARAQGRPTANEEAILRMADELLHAATLAHWKDRAAGAIAAGKELRLRDLRAVVTSARTVALDDEGKAQLKELQASLTERVTALRTAWQERLDRALSSGDVSEALAIAARPPEPSTRLASAAATQMAELASQALRSDASPEVWRSLVELVATSPIRRLVKPVGIPDDDASRALARQHAGAIPELAHLLGMRVPPPPPPVKPARRPLPRPRA